jgi:hypothetical protein
MTALGAARCLITAGLAATAAVVGLVWWLASGWWLLLALTGPAVGWVVFQELFVVVQRRRGGGLVGRVGAEAVEW